MSAHDPQPISLFEIGSTDTPRRRRPLAPPAQAEPAPALAPVTEIPLLLTMTEAATLLRIGRTTIYKLAELHRSTHGASGIPTVRVGNKVFVRRTDLQHIVGPDDAA
jgi:excisionase family DNA binding protein